MTTTEVNYEERARASAFALYDEGHSAAEVSRMVGVAPGTVWSWLNRAGKVRKPRKQQIAEEAAQMYLDGATYQQVADHFQVARALICVIAKERGIAGKGGRSVRTSSAYAKARGLYAQGHTYAEIARDLKLSPSTVAGWTDDIDGGAELTAKKDKIRSLESYGKGATIETIASTLGRSVNTVSGWLYEAGVEVLRSVDRQTPEQRAEYSAKGVTARQAKTQGPAKKICEYEPCGKEFELPAGRRTSRQRYCSRDHAFAARREGSGKTTTYTCQYEPCGKDFSGWTNQPRKYCTHEHYLRSNKNVPEYGFEGRVLQGGYEAAFIGLCSVRGLPFEFFDRAECVGRPGSLYGPDFKVVADNKTIYIDTKGAERHSARWGEFRVARGPLVILRREGLDELMRTTQTRGELLVALSAMAAAQALPA